MRQSIFTLTILFLTSCNLADKKNIEKNQQTTNSKVDVFQNAYDSLATAFVDTSTLKGKRQLIMNHFLIDNGLQSSDFDTLFDVTYDGFKDYVIGYYGKSGTGIKNRVQVYFFDKKKDNYIFNEQLSNLPNPTFYINKKKITGFYIGNGGGSGSKLEWTSGKWTTTKEFDVDNEGDTTKWKINFPLTKKKNVIIRQYQMIPPNDILETKIDF
jgi:hypothetical protein